MAAPVTERRLLTIAEAAETLRVSPRTIRRLIADGLPAVRISHRPGASLRIDERDLAAWLRPARRDGEAA